jgi:hypothetical protein
MTHHKPEDSGSNDEIPRGSGKQFARGAAEEPFEADDEANIPEGSGKQFAEDLSEEPRGVPGHEQGKGFARDGSPEAEQERPPDAPGDSGKGFARGAPPDERVEG